MIMNYGKYFMYETNLSQENKETKRFAWQEKQKWTHGNKVKILMLP